MSMPGGPQDRLHQPAPPQDWPQPPGAVGPPPPYPQAPAAPQHPGPHPGPPYGAPPGYAPPGGAYGSYGGYGGRLPESSAGRRFGAYLLDVLLLMVTLSIGWIIWSLVIWGKGQTPAKQLMHMRCVDLSTGAVAGWGTMALRELVGKVVIGNVTCGISTVVGGAMILGDGAPRQALWDKIASTVVVDDPQDTLAR
jgi:uncharacterized RDD family membrane protein YckC